MENVFYVCRQRQHQSLPQNYDLLLHHGPPATAMETLARDASLDALDFLGRLLCFHHNWLFSRRGMAA